MRDLDAFLRRSVACGDVPGAVVCVARRGEVLWHEAYGAAAWEPERRAMRRDTRFDVASLTKVIVTTQLVLDACAQGLLRLDDPLRRFYPDAPADVSAVTVRQLLAHSGGFAAWMPLYGQVGAGGEARQRRRRAARLILRQPLAYRPDEASIYSDLGFMVLGDILETCHGEPLDVLFVRRIAEPLRLGGIGYLPLESGGRAQDDGAGIAATERCEWRRRLLCGEVHDANAWALGGVAAHAGLFATAAAVWEFVHAMMESEAGRLDWLPPSLLRQSWQRQSTPAGTTRALGWDTPTPGRSSSGRYFSPSSFGHLGFTGCSLWIDPERQVSVVLCTNRLHPSGRSDRIARLRPSVHDLAFHALGAACA